MKGIGKIRLVLALTLVLGLTLVYAVPARAEMYAEIYGGAVQGANAPLTPGFSMDWQSSDQVTASTISKKMSIRYRSSVPGHLNPPVIGGLKIGTWFVQEGFLGYSYPGWMKYLGFYLDFCMHRLDFRRQTGPFTLTHKSDRGEFTTTGTQTFFSQGFAPTLAFMFAGRFGFLPDAEVPFGRVQPYLAVGPGILFASQDPKIALPPGGRVPGFDLDSNSEAVICLAVDAGVRWMLLKNVSLDLSFKYRFAEPRFTYHFVYAGKQTGPQTYTIGLDPTYHLFSGQVGVAYHF